MAVSWIAPTAHPTEEYECLDCYLVDVLSVHGQCQRCGSSAVFPLQILEQIGTWVTVGEAPYWVPRDPEFPNNPKRKVVAFEPHRVGANTRKKPFAPAAPTGKKCA